MSFTPGAGTRFLVSTGASGTTPLSGPLSITGGTATANTPVLSATQTWNNAAVTFTGWQLNVTDTASNANSLLMDLQRGGVSRFSVRKGGDIGVFAATGTPSTGGFSIRLQDAGGDANDTGFGVDSSGNLWQNVAASGPGLISYIGGSEQMRLTSTGLGIGTSSPGAKLEVAAGTGFPTARFTRVGTAAQTGSADIGMSQLGFPGSTNADTILRSSYGFGLQVNSAGSLVTALVADLSGNLGVGVTPSAWSGLAPALQVQRASIVTSSASAVDTYFSSNAFYDGSWKYILSAPATQYIQNTSGDHRWRVAASGTAGNAISFTQAMTLDASGNLGIGTTSTASGRLTVDSNSGIPSLLLTNSSTGNPYLSFQSGGFIQDLNNGSLRIRAATALGYIDFDTNAARRFRIDNFGNSIFGTAAIATNATNGFVYVPTCAGTPTGTPTTYTGTAPIVVDTTNNKLYFYSGGAWRDAGP